MSNGGRSAFVDYLRCAAFLAVFAQHVLYDEIERLAALADGRGWFAALDRLVRVDGAPGIFGVVLFFMISGYCIFHAARRESARRFGVRRVVRIYPLLVVALAAEVLLAGAGAFEAPAATALELVGSATLLGDFLATPPRLAGVEWTLRLELLFYVAVGAWLVVRSRRAVEASAIAALPACLAVLALIVVLPAFPVAGWSRGYVTMFAPFLVIGVAFAAFERARLSALALTTVVVASLAAGWWTQVAIRPDYARFQAYYAVAFALFALAWALRGRIVGSRLVYRVALLTYATYLFHGFLVRSIERGLGAVFPAGDHRLMGVIGLNDVAAIVLFFALMAMLVVAVEQPLIRWSKRV